MSKIKERSTEVLKQMYKEFRSRNPVQQRTSTGRDAVQLLDDRLFVHEINTGKIPRIR